MTTLRSAPTVPFIPSGLRSLLGSCERAETLTGGLSHLTFSCVRGGARVVVKAGQSDVQRVSLRREATLLSALEETAAVPAPRLLEAIESPDWTVIVLSLIEGRSGLDLVGAERRIDDVISRVGVLGRVLHGVHQTIVHPRGPHGDFDVGERLGALGLRLAEDEHDHAIPADVAARFAAAVASVHVRGGNALVHGDFGFHNTLWDGQRLTGVVDWENGGFGSPLLDLAWAWWTFRHRALPAEVFDAFVEGYGRGQVGALGWEQSAVRALLEARMAQFALDSAHTDEWVRRARALDDWAVSELPG